MCGSRLSDSLATYSRDRYVFCCCGPVIKQFGCTTGEEIIELKGHSDTVVGVFLNPNNSLQVRDALLHLLALALMHRGLIYVSLSFARNALSCIRARSMASCSCGTFLMAPS